MNFMSKVFQGFYYTVGRLTVAGVVTYIAYEAGKESVKKETMTYKEYTDERNGKLKDILKRVRDH